MINIYDLPREKEVVEMSEVETAQVTGGSDAQLSAEFSAESQIFQMVQEVISISVKSIGEGMSSVTRPS